MPKIVLVDDEIWALRGLESLLQEYPEYHRGGNFTNGQEALAYLRTHPCDVVFTDLHMDQMGGQQLIAACTQERIPVRMVIISAYSDFSAAREGLRSGVVDYLLSPSPERIWRLLWRGSMASSSPNRLLRTWRSNAPSKTPIQNAAC